MKADVPIAIDECGKCHDKDTDNRSLSNNCWGIQKLQANEKDDESRKHKEKFVMMGLFSLPLIDKQVDYTWQHRKHKNSDIPETQENTLFRTDVDNNRREYP